MGWALSRDHTLQGECRTPLSLCRLPCYFKTSLKRRAERDDTALNSESIIRPIYQLGSLYTINKHITALGGSAPRGSRGKIQSDNCSAQRKEKDAASIRGLCLLRLDLFSLSPRPTHTLHTGTRPFFRVTVPCWWPPIHKHLGSAGCKLGWLGNAASLCIERLKWKLS